MSLSIAIDQVCRRTWWYDNDRNPPTHQRKHNMADSGAATRAAIADALRGQGRLSAAEIVKRSGCTKGQVWHGLRVMEEAGQVIKAKLVGGQVYRLAPAGELLGAGEQA